MASSTDMELTKNECSTIPDFIKDKIEQEVFELLNLSLSQEKKEPYVFLSSISDAYIKVLDTFPKPFYPNNYTAKHIDALMIDNPTDDFLSFSLDGEKVCKIIVKEMQRKKAYTEKSSCNEEYIEKSIYIHREDIFHPVHYQVYQSHFLQAISSLKALLIMFPLYKQTHPIADMIIRSFSRKDIESLRISGESILDNEHITMYYNMLVCTKNFLSTDHFKRILSANTDDIINRALYSIFTLYITGEPESYKNVQHLSVDTTAFRRIVIDLSVFSLNLKRITIEQNYFLHTVIIVVPQNISSSDLPEIEADAINEECSFTYILSDDFNRINY